MSDLVLNPTSFFTHWDLFCHIYVFPNKYLITYKSFEGHKDIKNKLIKLKDKEIKKKKNNSAKNYYSKNISP